MPHPDRARTQPYTTQPVAAEDRFPAAYSVLRDGISACAFPGCAFAVLAGDRLVLADALGRFDYGPASPAVTVGTVFDLASVTKVAATTAAAMLLYQRGQLDLDQPLGDLLPAFVIGGTAASAPTTYSFAICWRTTPDCPAT